MSIFFAASPPRPTPAVNPWPGVSMSWTGTDGTLWPLTDYTAGVWLLGGVRGMGRFRPEVHASASAGVHGAHFRGLRFGSREVFWPVKVYENTNSQAWLARDRAWWASLNPRGVGVWRVTQPDGTWRELTCRPLDDDDREWSDSPGLRNWQNYGIYLVAEDPFWYGPEITSPLWTAADPQPFINTPPEESSSSSGGEGESSSSSGGPEYYAPPFHPGTITTAASASLTNPGDESAWPKWTATGPLDGVSIELDGSTVSFGSLSVGEVLVIDTDPRVQSAWLDGADVTGDLTSWDFAPIPAGETVSVSIAMTGAGTLRASYRPRFDRAW